MRSREPLNRLFELEFTVICCLDSSIGSAITIELKHYIGNDDNINPLFFMLGRLIFLKSCGA